MSTIDDFLGHGRLGPLAEGQTTDDVRALLGDPEATTGPKWPQIWKYGPLQLTFHRDSRDEAPHLVSIALYFRHPEESLPTALGTEGWYPPAGCTFASFEQHLREVGIGVEGGVTTGPDKHLVVGRGVRVTFDEDRLDSIHYTSRREPTRKQLTVSIPRDVLDAIRSEARARGISIAALCSGWIEERAGSLARVGDQT
jgi:hypothetical protein